MKGDNYRQPEDPVWARLWLALVLIGMAAASLTPFRIINSWAEIRLNMEELNSLGLGTPTDLFEILLHFAGYFFVGNLVVLAHRGDVKRQFLSVVLIVIAGIFAIECLQVLAGRHARFSDLVWNIGGFLTGFGFMLGSSAGLRFRTWYREKGIRFSKAINALICVATLMFWWGCGMRPAFGAPRMDWDPSFPLVMGGELTEPRPWIGEIRFVGIHRGALGEEEIGDIHRHRVGDGLAEVSKRCPQLLAYSFQNTPVGKAIEPDGVLKSEGLELQGVSERMLNGGNGLRFSGTNLVRTTGPASKIAETISAAEAFSLEVWFRSLNLDQSGPARIVGVSGGPLYRNFTLAQDGRNLVFRVRNQLNGENGALEQLVATGVVDGSVQHVVCVYDRGVSGIFIEGVRIGDKVDLRDPGQYFPLGGRTATGKIFIALFLVCGIAIPLASFSKNDFEKRLSSFDAGVGAITGVIAMAPYLSLGVSEESLQRSGLFLVIFVVVFVVAYPLLKRCIGALT
jgi:VanZ family protein